MLRWPVTCWSYESGAQTVKPRVQAGGALFLIGAYCAALEVANVNFRYETRRWVAGERPDKPALALAPLPPRFDSDFLSFYGAYAQYAGAWLYMLGTGTQLAASHVAMNEELKELFIVTPYFLGGALFLAGGYLLAAEAAHSWVWALAPPHWRDWRNVGRWVQFLNLAGSLLFFLGGAAGYFTAHVALTEWQVINGSTYALGSALFLVQSVLLTAEWAFPRI
jgi:hypothetical protein